MSLSIPSTPDAHAALEAAVTHVAEDSFYAFAEAAADDWPDCVPAGSAWVEAEVSFHGTGEGRVVCRVPEALATDLTLAFLGASEEALAGDGDPVADMTGELANMICGCWLTRAYPASLFQLDRPAVRRVAEVPGAGWRIVLLNDVPVGIAASLAVA